MMRRGRDLDAKRRMLERWRKQDESKRLRDCVPDVRELSIAVEERAPDDVLGTVSHVRRVPVDSAPALFEIPCSNRDCLGGIFDLTAPVLAELRAGKTRFDGTCRCSGEVDGAPCPHEARYVGVARYEQARRAAEGAKR